MSLMTIAELEQLEKRQHSIVATAPITQPVKVTARDARHQVLGAIKIIARMAGMDMTKDVHPTELLVQRIDELEAQAQAREAEITALKAEKAAAVKEHQKALRNIAAVLETYSDPFDVKPFSKWKNDEKGKWMLAVAESIKWAVQRADNQLDPVNAVPIAADPE
jgi:hypothetical protein